MTHLAIAGPLPPARTGPADYVARSLPALSALAEVTCLTADPSAVDPELRRRWRVRSLEERTDPEFDLVVYHVANNPFHEEVLSAALAGPPGLLVLHDGSLHHLLSDMHLKHDLHDAYRQVLRDAHGADGEALARVRSEGSRGDVELFLFDLLGPLVDRHLGAVVHSRYAADLVARRAPGTPTWVVPHFAHRLSGAPLAPPLPAADVVIGHFGFVTPPKRPVEILEAFARLRADGVNAHLVFCGADHTRGKLGEAIARLGVRPHVTLTGYASESMMAGVLGAVDVVVSVRSPHVGETSGTLATALAAGKAVVADSVGTWAELPPAVVERVGGSSDTELVDSLTAALRRLAGDPELRAQRGKAAAAFASEELAVEHCMRQFVDAAKELVASPVRPAHDALAARAAAIADLRGGGPGALEAAVATTGTATSRIVARAEVSHFADLLALVPPARPGQRLLDLGGFAPVMRLLSVVWGYDVMGCARPAAPTHVELDPSAGLPAFTAEMDRVDPGAGRLPYAIASFDVITAADVADHSGMLRECNRVLRPGGVLILITPARAPEDVRAALRDAGLSDDRVDALVGGDGVVAVARKVGLPSRLSA